MYFCVVPCIVCFVMFPVLFVCICVMHYCHRVATQLQLNIYHIISQDAALLHSDPLISGQRKCHSSSWPRHKVDN